MSNQDPSSMADMGGSFMSHLMALRESIIKAILGWLFVFILLTLYPGAGYVYDVLALPMTSLMPNGQGMIATGIITPFLVPLKFLFLVSFVISMPWVMYQIWRFVAPGLYRHEKKMALLFIVSTCLLFLLGMIFCYFVVFKTVFMFIHSISPSSVMIAPDIEAYLGFVMMLFIAFGLTFEVPVIVVLLVKMQWVTLSQLRRFRPYLIVCSFVVAAILTPPDVMSQFLLAVPLLCLYEVGLLVSRLIETKDITE